MITLPQQIRAVVVFLAAGWIFGFCAHLHNSFWILLTGKKRKLIVDFLGVFIFVTGLFFSMFAINGGRTHPYLIALMILGLWIYEQVYDPVFTPFFHLTESCVKTIFMRTALAFSACFSIINVPGQSRKGDKEHGKSTGKRKRAKKAPKK